MASIECAYCKLQWNGKNYFQMYFHSVFCNNNNISTFVIFFSHDWVDLFGLLLYTCKSYNIIWQLLCSSWNSLISDLSASSLKYHLVLRLRSSKDDTQEICIHSENVRTFPLPQNTCFALWPELLGYLFCKYSLMLHGILIHFPFLFLKFLTIARIPQFILANGSVSLPSLCFRFWDISIYIRILFFLQSR